MKVGIPTSALSEVQKANILSKTGETLPEHLFFEMSAKYASILAKMEDAYSKQEFSVDSGTIFFRNIHVHYAYGYDADKNWRELIENTYPKNIIAEKLASGELELGGSLDTIMSEIEALFKKIDEIQENTKRITDLKKAKEEAERPLKEARAKLEEAQRDREKAEQAELKAKNATEEAIKKQQRIEWVKEHGSERLRKGVEQGYFCNKVYETEFGGYHLTDVYVYDRDEKVDTKDRSCPSLEALNEVERISKIEGLKADIVWLPDGLGKLYGEGDDDYDEEEPNNGCEAVRVDVRGTSGYWYKTF